MEMDIVIADDHPIMLLGIKTFLERKGYNIHATCSNGLEVYNQIIANQPKLAIIDINMPGLSGIEILQKMQLGKCNTKAILLTMHNELSIFNLAKELGTKGYLLKEFAMEELDKCLETVIGGGTYFSHQLKQKLVFAHDRMEVGPDGELIEGLTFAEKKVLNMVAQQKSTREIASLLFISEKTVETHRGHIIKKLNIPPGKNALLMWAMRMRTYQ